MSDTTERRRTPDSDPAEQEQVVQTRKPTRRGGGDPSTRGRTTIADGVVEKIAGLAARDVVGVHAMGSGISRTFGAVRDRVPGGGSKSVTRGVKAEVGEVQTALDLEIVVDYGVAISEVARAVRENVVSAVERMTGLEVVEVNIAVSDVKLPEEEEEELEPRIQ
ncbi:Asp23/Gls24 family envelope stress response protein [Streptomyces sp. NPDC048002]|uniref:Asp23/Gls24 family envelope stress response protein n=1 Tax=unclassified Streptomyces TaxID=2593676 RepID=UPI0034103EE1